MKITRLLSISILLSVFFSCSHGFLKDPRLYNPKRKTVQAVAPEPELQLTGGVDPFDAEAWYNNPNSNGDETNPEEVEFAAEEFNQIQIAGWFSDKNVPTYTMTKGDVWKEGDATKREYVHSNAPSTEGQGWSITGVTYYQYRGINPNYEATGNYNVSLQTTKEGKPKLNRFYFYRFTGKGGGVQWLDNYLIAVDTYSKLIFAFSEPVEFSSMGAPTKWDPTDNEAFYGQMYQFYMYDPVGYVLKKGEGNYEIQLYQWFQDSLATGNYKANINTAYTDIAGKDKDKPGKSPFNSHDVNFFEENVKMLAGKTFKYREKLTNGGNGLKLYEYSISDDGKQLTKRTSVWNGLEPAPDDVVYVIGDGENASKGSVSGGNNDVSWFELKNEGKELHLSNGVIATTFFQDYGPQFLERIKNDPHYESEEDSYDFKVENPNSLIMNGDTYTYAGSPSDTNRTIYKKSILGVDWFYGVELNNSDYTVKMTRASSYNDIMWGTLGWEGNLKVEPKASFSDNVLNSSFHFRPKDDTGDGLYLYTWEFSEQGKIVTLKKTKWRMVADGTEITGVTVTNGNDEYNATASGISFKLSADMTTITVSGCSDPNGNGSFSRSFTDPGPSFLNRVKGAKYTGNGNSYQFDESGETLTYSVKFDWEDYINPFGPSDSDEFEYDGVSSEKNNVIATYNGYRVHLTQNDTIIKMATVYGVGDASVMKWEAYRVN